MPATVEAEIIKPANDESKKSDSKLKTKKKVKTGGTKVKKAVKRVHEEIEVPKNPDEIKPSDTLSARDETNDTKHSQSDDQTKKREVKETAKIEESKAEEISKIPTKKKKKVKKIAKKEEGKTDDAKVSPAIDSEQKETSKKKKTKQIIKKVDDKQENIVTPNEVKDQGESKEETKDDKASKKKKIKKKIKGDKKKEEKDLSSKKIEVEKETVKEKESTDLDNKITPAKDENKNKEVSPSKIIVKSPDKAKKDSPKKSPNKEENKVNSSGQIKKDEIKSPSKDAKLEVQAKDTSPSKNVINPKSPVKSDQKIDIKSPVKSDESKDQKAKSPVKSPSKQDTSANQKSPSKVEKVSPLKKSKSKIDPKLYAPKKVPFISLFCKFVLPYYDYIDTCCRLMSLWSKGMSKLWKRNEEKFIEQKLFPKRMLQLTDDFLETHKLDVSNIFYSFYVLDIVQINLKESFEKFIQSLINAMEQNHKIEYRKKDIEIFRIWCYRLTIAQENSVLKFLRKKVPEHKLYEIYDNKDKLDFITTESSCNYFRKPQFSTGSRMAMVTLSKSEEKEIVSQYSNCRLDYRFMFECQDKEDHLKKSECTVRCLSIKGFQKEKCESLLEWNKLNVSILKIGPSYNNLDCFATLTPNMQKSIKHFSIGFNFKDKPLNTKQGLKASEGLIPTLEKLTSLESLTVWGYPITTVVEALSKAKSKLQSVKIISGGIRNFMFDEKVGEMHCKKGIYEYRNGSLLYRITVRDGFFLYDEACSPIQKERCKTFNDYIEVRSFSVIQLLGDVTVTSYNDLPANSLTKSATSTPCIVIMKPHIKYAFIDHKKVLSTQIQFLRDVTKLTNRLSCDINNEGKFEFMKNYMHKFNWHDLTVSVELSKPKDRAFLIQTLIKQKYLKYLRLVIRSPGFLNEIIGKLHKINISDIFEIIIIDLMYESPDNKQTEETTKDVEMAEDVKDGNKKLTPEKNSSQEKEAKIKPTKSDSKFNHKKETVDYSEDDEETKDITKDVEMKDNEKGESKDETNLEKGQATEIENMKIINWFDEWKIKYPKQFMLLRWRARVIVEKDPKMPILQKKYKIKSYCEEDC